ncbi:Ada metal-binding domain-containing protein (plasmid) [Priestia megaterium]|uniref:Ada metal-binding domain-containing protein n=1 Tax=Priestia megaterium TaxID=1404 RepID=UPI0035CC78C7
MPVDVNRAATDVQWKAIQENDTSFDTTFFYAVKTTKIFCKPSCPSRDPKRENVEIFFYIEDAQRHNYRACKRCKPKEEK